MGVFMHVPNIIFLIPFADLLFFSTFFMVFHEHLLANEKSKGHTRPPAPAVWPKATRCSQLLRNFSDFRQPFQFRATSSFLS